MTSNLNINRATQPRDSGPTGSGATVFQKALQLKQSIVSAILNTIYRFDPRTT
jgi:hypothetical protein